MNSFIWVFTLAVLLLHAAHTSCETETDQDDPEKLFPEKIQSLREGRRKGKSPETRALEAWAHSLTPKDYNYTEWRHMYHSSSTVDFFNGYARKLSKLFKEHEAKINFAMIGMSQQIYVCMYG